jgi:YD repeat-containing protein
LGLSILAQVIDLIGAISFEGVSPAVSGRQPSGENLKQRVLEYDALGRLTSAFEETSQTMQSYTPALCAQSYQFNGFQTEYTYDVNNNILSVTQAAKQTASPTQTRIRRERARALRRAI